VVLAGTLGGNGSVQYLKAFGGTNVSPGESAGRLSIVNDYTQLDGATLEMELNGTTPVTEYDQLNVGRTARLDGVLAVKPLGGYAEPAAGGVDTFDLISAITVMGSFDEVQYDGAVLLPTFGVGVDGSFTSHVGGGIFRSLQYSPNAVVLENYSAIPGDANGDKFVDGTDFNIWNSFKFTGGTDWLTGDFNGDGFTDASDFNIWNAHKFTQVADSSVPEPAGIFVPLAVAMALRLRRRR
jgi:uncharacterized protein (TIGR03382 family)